MNDWTISTYDALEMNLRKARHVHGLMAGQWEGFVERMAREGDDSLLDTSLVSVISRYGQNREICQEGNLSARRDDQNVFEQQVRVKELRFITFAIASTIT